MKRWRRFAVCASLVVATAGLAGCVYEAVVAGGANTCDTVRGSANDEPDGWPIGWVAYKANFSSCENAGTWARSICAHMWNDSRGVIESQACTNFAWVNSGGTGTKYFRCIEGHTYHLRIWFRWEQAPWDTDTDGGAHADSAQFVCPGAGGGGSSGPWAAAA